MTDQWATDEWLHVDHAVKFSGLSALRLRDLRLAGAIQGRKARGSWWFSRQSIHAYQELLTHRRKDGYYGQAHPLRPKGWQLMQQTPALPAKEIAAKLRVTSACVVNWQIQLLHHYGTEHLWANNTDLQLAERFAMSPGTVARAREWWSRKAVERTVLGQP
ncbi:hypothetical protein [Rhodococcus sp. JS3073]|uniref:hypothetical protein n=1 Tax=Rhodococcus sp. JS3073 TaxID=3002901 RepID=UPI0022859F20|nr:hypothetical protein [Rhodococcus sp. JS3073]WAM13936.1 hypothetical protein OYT95_31620 [Rhodococcus sp. JS3073]